MSFKDSPQDYLGDGVYVHFDGYHMILEANGTGHDATDRIAIEPLVYEAFTRYHTRLVEWVKTKNGAGQ